MAVGKEKNVERRSRTKETLGELKKVTWPSFGKVVKATGTVLAVVCVFTIVLFGIDYGLGHLHRLLVS